MSKKLIFWFAVVVISAVFGTHVGASELMGAKAAKQVGEPTLEQMLTWAIQDEYLAQAEYAYIIKKFGEVRPFSNIIKAEENHISMLAPLFKTRGLAVPPNKASEYIVIPKDLKTAVETGVQAEIDNIAMYERFLAAKLPDDVRDVFTRLKDASENHLRAFRNALNRY